MEAAAKRKPTRHQRSCSPQDPVHATGRVTQTVKTDNMWIAVKINAEAVK